MFKEILFNQEARDKILKGLNITAQAVGSTLGPKGQNVIFEESSFPTITKDGVTVANQIFLEDKFENMGVMLAREAAENTNREAGDGTTTTVCLLASMVNEANKYIATGMNPILIKRGMDQALEIVLKSLQEQIKPIRTDEEKLQIATIAANNDEKIGKMIYDVIKKVGIDGVVTVQTSSNLETEVEYVKGTKLNQGFQVHLFINNPKKLSVEVQNPVIILCTDSITNQDQLVPLIEKLVLSGRRNMVLLANTIEGSALAFLAQNHMLGKFSCVPVKLPSFGDYQKDLIYDLATLTEATVLGLEDTKKIEDATPEDCGTCETIIIDRDSTIISGGKGDISKRIAETKGLFEKEKDLFKISKLKDRLGRLTGSIANIKVGGASETEQTEIKYRIEDALNATKSAIEEGIVEGGGVALLKASEFNIQDKSKEISAGKMIVYNSLREPIRKIASNAGMNGDSIADKVLDIEKGYNALTNNFEDLFKSGVIDPFKVVKNEITNAVATAGILITSGAAIVIKPEKKNG
jgi:chaperonin GroEL